MGAVSPVHLIIVLVVALLVLGPGKLPETGEALGKAVRDFRRALADDPPVSTSGVESATQLAPRSADGPAIIDHEADHPA